MKSTSTDPSCREAQHMQAAASELRLAGGHVRSRPLKADDLWRLGIAHQLMAGKSCELGCIGMLLLTLVVRPDVAQAWGMGLGDCRAAPADAKGRLAVSRCKLALNCLLALTRLGGSDVVK